MSNLFRTLLTHGYRANLAPGSKEYIDVYDIATGALVGAMKERQVWEWLAGMEDTIDE